MKDEGAEAFNVTYFYEFHKSRLEQLVRENISPYRVCEAKPLSKSLGAICREVTGLYQKEFPEDFENLTEEETATKVSKFHECISRIVNTEFIIISGTELKRHDVRARLIVEESKDSFESAFEAHVLSVTQIRDVKALFKGSKINKCMKVLALRIVDAQDEDKSEVESKLKVWLQEVVNNALELIKHQGRKAGIKSRNSARLVDSLLSEDAPDGYFQRRDFKHPAEMGTRR